MGHGPDSRQIAFTTAIIVLAAKMAKSDGKVTADEIATFKRLFQIPNDEQQAVAQIWVKQEMLQGLSLTGNKLLTFFHRKRGP